MEKNWSEFDAQKCLNDLELRAYSSRLLGREDDLVLHGGGNTSVKVRQKNIFGEEEEILWVKGSGHDLKTIGTNGFSPCRLAVLKKLGALSTLSDTDMMRELKVAMINPSAPAPSVEAILHALIPHKFVDHTHTDAVVTVSNSPQGEKWIQEIYGDKVLVLPYIMPGFILAKQVYQATQKLNWDQIKGIFLLHHGLFTFSDSAKEAYENMIELVTLAEKFLLQKKAAINIMVKDHQHQLPLDLIAHYRKEVSTLYGAPLLMRTKQNPASLGYASWTGVNEMAFKGPITPDHVLHTKRTPMLMKGEPANDVQVFCNEYQGYFERNNRGDKTILDQAPRVGIYPHRAICCWGSNAKRLQVVEDITDHTIKCVQQAQALGGWQALPEKDIFELEYWELEQAKLKVTASKLEFEGQIALVTGAASGIGKACAMALLKKGAAVVGLDINPSVEKISLGPQYLGITCDLTITEQIQVAIRTCVENFGGLDILVSNAGNFPTSTLIEKTTDGTWDQGMELNLNSHFRLLREVAPMLKQGFYPNVIFMASKNVPAPGPGVASYSVAKAGLTQLARVAALELGEFGIRVNVVHPNAVFDTGIWSDEVIAKRAQSYGVTVDEYKRKNILKTEITSEDVASLVCELASSAFSKTTGLQATIDGGDLRVI